MRLPPVAATALAAAIVAGISVLAFAWIPALLPWAAFIGWACYDQSGADPQAWLRSSAGLVFGVVMAGAVAIIVASNALPVAACVATAVCAAIASFLIVTGSAVLTQGAVAAAFYGFASTFAFVGLAPGASTIGAMTSLSASNALLVVPVSLLIGTLLGVLHGRLAKVLAASSEGGAHWRSIRLDGSALPRRDDRKAGPLRHTTKLHER